MIPSCPDPMASTDPPAKPVTMHTAHLAPMAAVVSATLRRTVVPTIPIRTALLGPVQWGSVRERQLGNICVWRLGRLEPWGCLRALGPQRERQAKCQAQKSSQECPAFHGSTSCCEPAASQSAIELQAACAACWGMQMIHSRECGGNARQPDLFGTEAHENRQGQRPSREPMSPHWLAVAERRSSCCRHGGDGCHPVETGLCCTRPDLQTVDLLRGLECHEVCRQPAVSVSAMRFLQTPGVNG